MNIYRYRIVKTEFTESDKTIETTFSVERSVLGIMWTDFWGDWNCIRETHSHSSFDDAFKEYQKLTEPKKQTKEIKTIVHP
jgi:Zn/Cd-binding protein ZinT